MHILCYRDILKILNKLSSESRIKNQKLEDLFVLQLVSHILHIHCVFCLDFFERASHLEHLRQ